MFIITGGGTGIGRALALALAARNQDVLIIGRRKQVLQDVAEHSDHIHVLPADVASVEGRRNIIKHLQDNIALKGLIHCAGIIKPVIPITKISEREWQVIQTTNVDSAQFLTQALLDKLKNGRILYMGSKMANEAVFGLSGYCVSKAALSMLLRCWKIEHPEVAITEVFPGVVNTDMPQAIIDAADINPERSAILSELKQKGHLLPPETSALFLTWLLLDTDSDLYSSKKWDIYDLSHHTHWLVPPHHVVNMTAKEIRKAKLSR